MRRTIFFQSTQALYWLALGVWLGALVMLAVAAPVIFKTVRFYEPVIGLADYQHVQSVAANVIAGGAVGNILRALTWLQGVCAVAVAVAVVLQCSVFSNRVVGGVGGWRNMLRMALLAMPVLILLANIYLITPRVWALRRTMYDANAQEAKRVEARGAFAGAHRLSEQTHGAALFMLAGAVVVSAFTLHGEGGKAIAAATRSGQEKAGT